MSFFDELSRDSFLSKKAANKQSSAARRTRKGVEAKDAPANFNSGIAMNASGKQDTEFGSDMAGYSQYGTQTYSHAGVSFDKLSESEARISYSGLLSKSGADKVIGVYGYRSNQSWEDVSEVVLAKDYTGGFSATIPISRARISTSPLKILPRTGITTQA